MRFIFRGCLINSISYIEPQKELMQQKAIFHKKYQNYQILKENNFNQLSILSPSQIKKYKEEENKQVETIEKQDNVLKLQIEQLSKATDEYIDIIPEIKALLNSDFCKKINYKFLSDFKPSMTFIQNPLYRKTYNLYKQILNSEGIDIHVFDIYDKISEYSIRDMPIVYELWVLISVIRSLEKNFRIKHNPDNLRKLLEVITPENKKIDNYVKIEFDKPINNRKITLHYQKQLENKKRPDIILEITANINTENQRTIYVVLDAKYKNFKYKTSIYFEIQRMVDKYKIDDNYFIFIAHPCDDKADIKLTNFGGEKIYINDEEQFPFHKYGYIKAKPSDANNIKKIIGMSLEYLTEKNHKAFNHGIYDPKPENSIVCLNCGNKQINLNKISRQEGKRFYYSANCTSKNCNHHMLFDYCWNCQTKLFKHGRYWDYHKTSIWNTFDIHCPNCEMTLADRPDSQNS